ncbi:hypothetical protein ACEPAH_2629 [Sanghuangporus vaninii]
MRKGPLWEASARSGTTPSISALRNIDLHNERRKLWNHGFTSASIKQFQPAVESRVIELVEELRKRVSPSSGGKENPLDLALWLSNFTFARHDFMGDMVFGGGLGLMQSGDGGEIRDIVEGNVKALGILGKYHGSQFAFHRYVMRKEQESTKRDLFHYITNEEGLEKVKVPQDQSMNDILTAVVGGADTASSVLSSLFFHLLSDPSAFDRLKEEVDSKFPVTEGEPFDAIRLARMSYLNACINEALRLQPPVPTMLQRSPLEGSGGKLVAGRLVPESTAVYVPPYVLHRDPRYFSPFPDSFIPERWIDDSNKVHHQHICIHTILHRFVADYDPRKWDEELQDFMAMNVGELPVALNPRQ